MTTKLTRRAVDWFAEDAYTEDEKAILATIRAAIEYVEASEVERNQSVSGETWRRVANARRALVATIEVSEEPK